MREVGQAAGPAGSAGMEDRLRADGHGRLSVVPRGLPLPILVQGVRFTAALCAVTSVDVSGRLADRRPLQALGWFAGRTVEIVGRRDAIAVTARPDARMTIGGKAIWFCHLRCAEAAASARVIVSWCWHTRTAPCWWPTP